MARRKTPRYYYNQQKQNAKHRGIGWNLTFEQWWAIWRDSGKWDQRGCKRGQYVMARDGDQGIYEVGNVSIMEAGMNGSQGLKNWPAKKLARETQKTIDEQANIIHNAPIKTFHKPTVVIPVEELKVKEKQIAKVFPEKKENSWSWRNLFLEAFPPLKWVLGRHL